MRERVYRNDKAKNNGCSTLRSGQGESVHSDPAAKPLDEGFENARNEGEGFGMTAQAYPLQWPDNMPRSVRREKSKFKSTLSAALKNVETSLRMFGQDSGKAVTSIVLSSNCSLGNLRPTDSGVAAWFVWAGESVCIPVDRYLFPEENLQAIHHIIEARRVELRHGTLHLVKATMKGFLALPPPSGAKTRRPWTDVLGLHSSASKDQVEAAFREKAKQAHPDAGGSTEAMQELTQAKQEALTP